MICSLSYRIFNAKKPTENYYQTFHELKYSKNVHKKLEELTHGDKINRDESKYRQNHLIHHFLCVAAILLKDQMAMEDHRFFFRKNIYL